MIDGARAIRLQGAISQRGAISQQQKGIALLLAILIVALVSIVSVTMISQRQLQIQRTVNLYSRDQAYQFAFAVERWGLSALFQDLEQDKKQSKPSDSYEDIWNTELVDFDVEHAKIDGVIFDLQGRLNLNNLFHKNKVQKNWLISYKRLLLSQNLPVSLADTLLDWIDANEQPTGTHGAEDIYYIALEPPYRAANQPLAHLSELLLIKGYTREVLNTLKPYVYVAPSGTMININTSSAVVLRAIIPDMSDSQGETLMKQIDSKPFSSIDEFLLDPFMENKEIETSQLSVVSEYFVVNSNVSIDKIKISLQSILNRDKQGSVRVISRQESLLYDKPAVDKATQEKETK